MAFETGWLAYMYIHIHTQVQRWLMAGVNDGLVVVVVAVVVVS